MASLNPISGTLGAQRATHLLRRVTFGPTKQEIASFAAMNVNAAVAQILTPVPEPAPPIDPVNGLDWVSPVPQPGGSGDNELYDYTLSWWFHRMKSSSTSIHERMVYFFHTHVPTILSRITHPCSLYNQLKLYRYYALGNYKELMKAIVMDNAMLPHLDGVLNIASLPQENFAREYFELFAVGKGPQVGPTDYTNFTEQDVQAATRVFTGWNTDLSFLTVDPVTQIPRGRLKGNGTTASQHDITAKTFSAAFNGATITPASANVTDVMAELDAFADMVFNSPHTSKHLCRKLYRFFVYWDITPEIETDIIAPLAQTLVSNSWNITPVLQRLLLSEHFYDADNQVTSDDNIGAIIKSPIEIVIGTWRMFSLAVPDQVQALPQHYEAYHNGVKDVLNSQGMDFFEPYDVAGYDAYHQFPGFNRNWITPNNLAMRYKFGEDIVTVGVEDQFGNVLVKLDVVDYVKNNVSDPFNATTLAQEIIALMIPVQLANDRFTYFRDNVLLDQLSMVNWTNEWGNYIVTNNDSAVRPQLEKFFIALMQCPEYQIF